MRFPDVPIVFCETRPLAQEWTYRFLGAALAHVLESDSGARRAGSLPAALPLPAPTPQPRQVRAWARANGFQVSDRGRIPSEVVAAFEAANAE